MPRTRLEIELAEAKSELEDLRPRAVVAEGRASELEKELSTWKKYWPERKASQVADALNGYFSKVYTSYIGGVDVSPEEIERGMELQASVQRVKELKGERRVATDLAGREDQAFVALQEEHDVVLDRLAKLEDEVEMLPGAVRTRNRELRQYILNYKRQLAELERERTKLAHEQMNTRALLTGKQREAANLTIDNAVLRTRVAELEAGLDDQRGGD